eukprot:Selendium_serpulae@DN10463_c0_g1_i1.p1
MQAVETSVDGSHRFRSIGDEPVTAKVGAAPTVMGATGFHAMPHAATPSVRTADNVKTINGKVFSDDLAEKTEARDASHFDGHVANAIQDSIKKFIHDVPSILGNPIDNKPHE